MQWAGFSLRPWRSICFFKLLYFSFYPFLIEFIIWLKPIETDVKCSFYGTGHKNVPLTRFRDNVEVVDGSVRRLGGWRGVTVVVLLSTSRITRGRCDDGGTAGRQRVPQRYRHRGCRLEDVTSARWWRWHPATNTIIDVLQYCHQAEILTSAKEAIWRCHSTVLNNNNNNNRGYKQTHQATEQCSNRPTTGHGLAMGAYGNFCRDGQVLRDMASAEREPITVVWGWASAGSRGRAPEAESFEAFVRLKEGPKLCCQYAKTV